MKTYCPHPQAAWLLRKGSLLLRFGQERETYAAGQWIFPRAEDGLQTFSEDAELLSIRFTLEWPSGISLFDRSHSHSVAASEVQSYTQTSERLLHNVEQHFPQADPHLRNVQLGLDPYFELQEIFAQWTSQTLKLLRSLKVPTTSPSHLDPRIRDALQRIGRQSWTDPMTTSDLATQVGLSLSQFNRLFLRETGLSAGQYREQLRRRAVQAALMDHSLTVKSIAMEYGFSSLPHFSAWVRKHFQTSPRAYRQAIQESTL
ncbi:MAG: helix-turn-helix domain-containing protein [Puniceicoccales bacterium]